MASVALRDLVHGLLTKYMEEYGEDYGPETFVDFIVAQVVRPEEALETWYERRGALFRAQNHAHSLLVREEFLKLNE